MHVDYHWFAAQDKDGRMLSWPLPRLSRPWSEGQLELGWLQEKLSTFLKIQPDSRLGQSSQFCCLFIFPEQICFQKCSINSGKDLQWERFAKGNRGTEGGTQVGDRPLIWWQMFSPFVSWKTFRNHWEKVTWAPGFPAQSWLTEGANPNPVWRT